MSKSYLFDIIHTQKNTKKLLLFFFFLNLKKTKNKQQKYETELAADVLNKDQKHTKG